MGLLLCLLLLPGAAGAASFDGSQPSSKLYHAMCADPELSQLDDFPFQLGNGPFEFQIVHDSTHQSRRKVT